MISMLLFAQFTKKRYEWCWKLHRDFVFVGFM